eukprot:Gb_00470 [translate_table: standard]
MPNTPAFASVSNLSADGVALLAFLKGLDERFVQVLKWTPTDYSPCSWRGVSCYRDGLTVRSLKLSNITLSGRLTRSFGQLTGLVALNLSYNYLEGEIVPEIGNCSRLKTLILNNNMFNGPIPVQLFRLTGLVELNLQGNLLSGSIPFQLGRLKNLEYLVLSYNYLTGSIPKDVLNLPKLQRLQLGNNGLNGSIPPELGKRSKITFISLENNHLIGSVPSSFGHLKNLTQLYLFGNQLNGTIPSELGNCSSLSVLQLQSNALQGIIPPELGRLGNLTQLDLHSNRLGGSIPTQFALLTNLSYLDLSCNLLSGNVHLVLQKMRSLRILDLSGNYFNGTISISDLCAGGILHVLRLGDNYFEGRFPTEIGRCSEMDISNNRLSGSITPDLRTNTAIGVLNVKGNFFEGSIPPTISLWSSIVSLDMSSNRFSGIYLFLGNNRLTGTIPSNLVNSDTLQRLDLSNNQLSGGIPCQLENTSVNLTYVNVSINKLAGKVPRSWIKILSAYPSSFVGNPHLCLDEQSEWNSCQLEGNTCGKSGIAADKVVSVVCSAIGLCFLGCLSVFWFLRNRRRRKDTNMETVEDLPQDLHLKEILEAAGDFREDNVIGEGTHGVVFKLEMPSGKIYAVKRLIFGFINSSFTLETETLGAVRHRNLVKIVGFWACQNWGLIVYEYMPNGNLHRLLHELNPPPVLNWEVRYRIALGVAHGLAYLHHDCVPQIIHRDIKSANILMDSDLEPHIADFCLAKQINSAADNDLNSWDAVVGTLGYIAPENGYSTRVDEKSEMCSYGVFDEEKKSSGFGV